MFVHTYVRTYVCKYKHVYICMIPNTHTNIRTYVRMYSRHTHTVCTKYPHLYVVGVYHTCTHRYVRTYRTCGEICKNELMSLLVKQASWVNFLAKSEGIHNLLESYWSFRWMDIFIHTYVGRFTIISVTRDRQIQKPPYEHTYVRKYVHTTRHGSGYDEC